MSSISKVNSLRMTGMVSGLDIDSMVKNMLVNQQSKLDKAKQQRELVNWQKDAYRSVITMMSDFQSKFLDILSSSSVTKAGTFKATETTVPETMSQYFTASVSSGVNASSVTVNKITQLATAQKVETADGYKIAGGIKMSVKGDGVADILGQSISFSLNGETKNITLSNDIEDYYDDDSGESLNINNLVNDINKKLEKAFGTVNGQAKLSIDASGVSDILDSNGNVSGYGLTLDVAENNTVQVSASSAVTAAMGFTNNATNYLNTERTISDVFGSSATSNGKIKFSINDVEFNFDSTAKIKDVMSEINKSSAGVNISYSSLNDKFTLTSKNTGSGNNIVLEDLAAADKDGNTADTKFLEAIFGKKDTDAQGDTVYGKTTAGKDAVLTVNDIEIVRSGNNITLDGVTLNLLKATPDGFTNTDAVTSKANSSQIVEVVKDFVSGYNSLVNTLNGLVSEKRVKNNGEYYLPLSDETKSAMSEKEVENWEEMGKKGLLNGDTEISKILSSLRTAISSVVETDNGRISFASIGITSASYTDSKNGNLVIDEDKLKQAIENDPDAVMELFTRQSTIAKDAKIDDYYSKDASGRYYSTDANGIKKYISQSDFVNMRSNSMGVAQRFSEIFRRSINVTVNQQERGTLIQKVGTGGKNTLIDNESTFEKKLAAMDTTILKIQNKLYTDEEKYYQKFAALETAIAKLNSQSSMLSSSSSS